MNWMQRISTSFEDMFGDIKKMPKVVSRDPPQSKDVTLQLWRGFDGDLENMDRSGDGFVMSPHKSEQGLIWFTHILINAYDPRDYVKGRGEYLLEYPLSCKKHFQRVNYEDGSHFDDIPEESLGEPTENSRFYQGYELPEGWYFSYKMEKFIVCSVPITVTRDMIKLNS